jgi:hypothetical protein
MPTGKIFGTVVDETGAALPGVAIEATSTRLVGRAAAVTDANGVYRLFALTPGTYKIAFTLLGFKPLVREGILVQVEQAIKLDVALEIGSIAEQVTVVGKSPLIDVKTTVKGVTMTRAEFERLPRGRDFDSLVYAVAGVTRERLLGGISIDGASGAENVFFVDGTEITNIYLGTRQTGVAFEFVDEVQVKASGYEAEFGGSLGGVISVISRQGGNTFHGDVLGFFEGSALTGKERDTLRQNLYDINRAEYVNYQDLYGKDRVDRFEAGFSLGGYIVKDKVWFFGSYLPVSQTTRRHVKFDPSLAEGDYRERWIYQNLQAKLTAQPLPFLRLGASFVNNFRKQTGQLPPRSGTGSPTDVYADYGWSFPDWIASAYADLTIGSNMLISLRGGSHSTNYNVDPQVFPTGPRWYHTGLGNSIYPDIPASLVRPRTWQNQSTAALNYAERQIAVRSHLNADATLYFNLAGEHAWKFGVQWVRNSEDWASGYKYPDCPSISLSWGRPAVVYGTNYGIGKYGVYNVLGNETTGPSGLFYKVHADRWAFYLQDSWTIGGRLTLNAGLRAESEYLPAYTDDPKYAGVRAIDFGFKDKLAPRIGAIYDVFGDSSLKVFANYAIYYDVMKLYFSAMTFGGRKQKVAYYSLDTYEWDKIGIDGFYPGNLLALFDNAVPQMDSVDPDMRPMSQREFSLGVEKQLGENASATLRLVQKHLRYAIEDIGVLIPGAGIAYYEANPGYGYSRSTTNGGKFDPKYPECPKAKREYWAVNLSFDKRFADNWMAGFSYTWSRLTGNYSGLASPDENGRVGPNVLLFYDTWFTSFDKGLNPVDGPLGTDRPHVLKVYGSYQLPFGLTAGTVVSAMSGTPVTEFWNIATSPFMADNRGNLGRTPFLWFANLYLEYGLRFGKTALHLSLNVDNLFDTAETMTIYPIRTLYALTVTQDQILAKNWTLEEAGFVPQPMFQMPYSFFPPITARLGMRLSF